MQIRTLQLLTILLLTSMGLYGQTGFESGYIVNLKNDTLYGKVKDRRPEPFSRIYQKVRFKKGGAYFARKYKPSQIVGYQTGHRVYESVGIETVGFLLKTRYVLNSTSQKSFLRVIAKDSLSYYHWEYIDNESSVIDYVPLLHEKGRAEMVRVTQGILGLKKKALTEYFSDCPELVRKIEDKEIRTPEDVMASYGNLCGGEN